MRAFAAALYLCLYFMIAYMAIFSISFALLFFNLITVKSANALIDWRVCGLLGAIATIIQIVVNHEDWSLERRLSDHV